MLGMLVAPLPSLVAPQQRDLPGFCFLQISFYRFLSPFSSVLLQRRQDSLRAVCAAPAAWCSLGMLLLSPPGSDGARSGVPPAGPTPERRCWCRCCCSAAAPLLLLLLRCCSGAAAAAPLPSVSPHSAGRAEELCGTRGETNALLWEAQSVAWLKETLAGISMAWGCIHLSSAVFKDITSNSSRFSPFLHFDNRIKDDLWSTQLKMVQVHVAPGGSYLYLKEYIFTSLSCSPMTDFRFNAYKNNKSPSRLVFFTEV